MDRLIIVIAVISLFFILLTYLLNCLFIRKRLVKYIPSLVSLTFAIINIVLARRFQAEGFKDLARVLMAVFLFVGFLSGILTAMYFDYVSPRYKKKK
jgi:hypothetical protein